MTPPFTKKKSDVKRKPVVKSRKIREETKLFVIEDDVPMPGKSSQTEADMIRKQALAAAQTMKVGQSFLIRSVHRTTIRKHLNEKFAETDKTFRVPTPKDRKAQFARVWRTS